MIGRYVNVNNVELKFKWENQQGRNNRPMLTTASIGDATLAASPMATLNVVATTTPMTKTTLKGSRLCYETK